MAMRTKVYDSIVNWLGDHRWHEISGLERVTRFPQEWLAELKRDPSFEVDAKKHRLRLRATSPPGPAV